MSNTGAERRLERLERVLQGRQTRLASAVARQRRPSADAGALGNLQRYGYPVALLLALTAVMPALVGFALRHRKLLVGAAVNGLVIRKYRNRFRSIRAESSR